jgi:hypothetical protein
VKITPRQADIERTSALTPGSEKASNSPRMAV